MENFKNDISEILKNEFNAGQIVEKNDNDTRLMEGLGFYPIIIINYILLINVKNVVKQ